MKSSILVDKMIPMNFRILATALQLLSHCPMIPHNHFYNGGQPFSFSRLVKGDQGIADSLEAPLPKVLLGQESGQHTPRHSSHWAAPSQCDSVQHHL